MSHAYRPRQPLKEYREIIESISSDAMQRILVENKLDVADQSVVYTVAMAFLECAAEKLHELCEANPNAKGVKIQMDSVLELGCTVVESETGEKAGNLVPYIVPGETFKLGVKNDVSTEE